MSVTLDGWVAQGPKWFVMVECECRSLLFEEGERRGTEKGDGDGHWRDSDNPKEVVDDIKKDSSSFKMY